MNRIDQLIKNGVPLVEAVEIVTEQLRPENRKGLSADCTLNKTLVMAILMGGREHPCDRCNMDRNVCRGFPRLDTLREFQTKTHNITHA